MPPSGLIRTSASYPPRKKKKNVMDKLYLGKHGVNHRNRWQGQANHIVVNSNPLIIALGMLQFRWWPPFRKAVEPTVGRLLDSKRSHWRNSSRRTTSPDLCFEELSKWHEIWKTPASTQGSMGEKLRMATTGLENNQPTWKGQRRTPGRGGSLLGDVGGKDFSKTPQMLKHLQKR